MVRRRLRLRRARETGRRRPRAGPITGSSIISGIARQFSVDNAIASGLVMTGDGTKARTARALAARASLAPRARGPAAAARADAAAAAADLLHFQQRALLRLPQ